MSKRDTIESVGAGSIVYRLHGHTVAWHQGSDAIILGTFDGRWQTRTTKSRINAFADHYHLPRIAQRNFVWTWSDGIPYEGVRTFTLSKPDEELLRIPL
ncbi:MAG TPA: hypothetical protein VLH56_18750 [Dissulfurispiraceae bacterium]|nr:hypothetical protein [Dissulfurispiraceae bacterium]